MTGVLSLSVGTPKKNLSSKDFKILNKRGSYVERKTENTARELFAIANSMDNALRKMDLSDINANSNNYVRKVFEKKQNEILNYVDKFKDQNGKEKNQTIKEKLMQFFRTYSYKPNDLTDFYIFCYESFEVVKLNLIDSHIDYKTPYLYELYGQHKLRERINHYLEENEKYSHFKFYVLYDEDNDNIDYYIDEDVNKTNIDKYKKQIYKMIIASETPKTAIVFEVINAICSPYDNKRYKVCANPQCFNLFRNTRTNRDYCGMNNCKSSLYFKNK